MRKLPRLPQRSRESGHIHRSIRRPALGMTRIARPALIGYAGHMASVAGARPAELIRGFSLMR